MFLPCGVEEMRSSSQGEVAELWGYAIRLRYGVSVETIEHVEGAKNIVCDAMSRGQSADSLGFQSHEIVRYNEDINLLNILRLCEPVSENCDDDDNQFMRIWGDTQKAVEALGLS